jgi:molybdopterin converting factor small subunit
VAKFTTKNKVQFNASISETAAEDIRKLSEKEGRKIGDLCEKMVEVYKGKPAQLCERLKRFSKKDLTDQDKVALKELVDFAGWLLYADDKD